MNIEIDPKKLFNDKNYRTLLTEYHSFTAYVISEFNRWDRNQITSSSCKFHKDSDIFKVKDELFQMIKQTFSQFDVVIEKYGDHYEIEEDEHCITVSWKNYIN